MCLCVYFCVSATCRTHSDCLQRPNLKIAVIEVHKYSVMCLNKG